MVNYRRFGTCSYIQCHVASKKYVLVCIIVWDLENPLYRGLLHIVHVPINLGWLTIGDFVLRNGIVGMPDYVFR